MLEKKFNFAVGYSRSRCHSRVKFALSMVTHLRRETDTETRICPDSTISSRPTNNGPTQRISWLLANALKPMLKNVPAHLQNSLELIRCIQAEQVGDLTTNEALPYPCSLDVVSLYTTIPIQEAITNATGRIQSPILHLSKHDVSDLLQVTLNNIYFSFRDQVFR